MRIAWINGEWHDSESRRDKIAKLWRYIEPRVKRKDTLTPDQKADLARYMREYMRLWAIQRGEEDLLFFAYYYFGENLNPDNAGNWIPRYDVPDSEGLRHKPEHILDFAPSFHREICDIMNVVSNEEVNKRVCVAAPRSHAKSSFLSKAFPAHEIAYRKRRYIILISETPSVSTANLEWLALQFKHNAKLRRDFGPLLHPKQQMNPKDNSTDFIAWEPRGIDGEQTHMLTLVQAASTGQALRGRNWNGTRPDLIVCDDLEDKRNTNTEQLRQELKDWFAQVVIPLGDPEGKRTAIVMMGTTVHHQSLLIDVMNHRSDFETKKYRALIQPPERTDLWEECRQIYVDRERKNPAREAELFYVAHKEEMDLGAVTLWPEVQPLWKLMTWKWDNGSKAFNTEYMNNPIDEESMIFNPDKFTYWDDKHAPGEFLNNHNYIITMGLDFAMGKQRGDYSAIAVLAVHKEKRIAYVLDSWGDKLHPDKFIEVIVSKVMKYQPDSIAAEAQQSQEYMVDTLDYELTRQGYPTRTRLHKIYQRNKKGLRIEGMLPDIEAGRILFSRKHALLLEQFERYGTRDHDDLIDALEMALSAGKKKIVRAVTSSKAFR